MCRTISDASYLMSDPTDYVQLNTLVNDPEYATPMIQTSIWPSHNHKSSYNTNYNHTDTSSYQSNPTHSSSHSITIHDSAERLLIDSYDKSPNKQVPILYPIARAVAVQPREISQQPIDTLTSDAYAHFKYNLMYIAELQLIPNIMLVFSEYWLISFVSLLLLSAAYHYSQRTNLPLLRIVHTSVGLICYNAIKNMVLLEDYMDEDHKSMWQTLTMIALLVDIFMLLVCVTSHYIVLSM